MHGFGSINITKYILWFMIIIMVIKVFIEVFEREEHGYNRHTNIDDIKSSVANTSSDAYIYEDDKDCSIEIQQTMQKGC